MLRVLISREHDDEVGVELLRKLDGVDVHLYDPDMIELDEEQRLASVLIPPYRSSHRPIRPLRTENGAKG